MPYALAINSGGVNVCGENAVNTDPPGKLDGFSIVLGHEIEETITDPGAEDVVSTGLTGTQTYEGGWYDAVDANENGDKCAWVGENLVTAQGPPEPIYGALGDITGNAGERFAAQSLWSNAANAGTGYCAGAGTDSPLP
jgi:serine protease